MANATPRATRAGFDLYQSAGGSLSLDELNEQLVAAGYGPVSQRTFTHYRHLDEAGYNRYVSINRFDVARASMAYDNASALGRYRYWDTSLGVQVVLAKSDRLLEAFGTATELGDVGAIVEFDDPSMVEGLKNLKPRVGDSVTLRFIDRQTTVAGRVVDRDLESDPARLEVEYARLTSLAEVDPRTPLQLKPVQFRIVGQDDEQLTLDLLGRRLYHFFGLLEGLRALANRAGGQSTEPVYAAPPLVQELRVASPADLLAQIPPEIVKLLPWWLATSTLKKIWEVPEKRNTWLDGDLKQETKRRAKMENDYRQAQLEAEQGERQLAQTVVDKLRTVFPDSEMSNEDVLATIDQHVLPHLRALGTSGVSDIEVDETGTQSEGPADDEDE